MTTEIILREPETKTVRIEVNHVVAMADNLVVADDKTLNDAAGLGREIKRRMTLVREKFKESIETAHKAHKKVVALRDEIINPLKDAEVTVKSKMSKYQLEQERIRIQAEEVARKEREQQEAEARRKHDEEIKKAEKEAEERQLKEAEKAEESGDTEKAEVVLDSEPEVDFTPEPPPVEAPPVMPEQKKPEGTTFSKVVKWRITHPEAIPRDLCSPDPKKIDKVVKAYGMKAKIAGIACYEDVKTIIRK